MPDDSGAAERQRSRPKEDRRDRYDWERARGRIEAFGESKALRAWADDERCAVSREALRTRLALGWDPEDAITRARHDRPDLRFTYGGRTLSLQGWAEQSGIAYHTLYNRIKASGMTFAEALEKGADGPHFILPVTAFGETKPLSHWAVDPRAGCSYKTLRTRLAEGWDPEQAITEEPQHRSALGTGTPYRAFGRSMGLEDWARHAQIPASDLRGRIARHRLPLEEVLTSLGWTPHAGGPVENNLLLITAAQLRPGDRVLGVDDTTPGRRLLAVRRPGSAPPREGLPSSATAVPSPPAAPRPPAARR
ncbi:hypothetical protein [Streptomyces vietnamensis]|uniref:hypothetical protein n=1 Tax=Streptomyces vietnamensis TaxID=362257 RepID=UPI003434B5AD